MTVAITTAILQGRVGSHVGTEWHSNVPRAVRFDWLPEDGAAVRLSVHMGAGCYEDYLLDRAELARAATVDRDVRRLGASVVMVRLGPTLIITIHPPTDCHGTGATVVYVPAEQVRRFCAATIDACPIGSEVYDLDAELSSLLEES